MSGMGQIIPDFKGCGICNVLAKPIVTPSDFYLFPREGQKSILPQQLQGDAISRFTAIRGKWLYDTFFAGDVCDENVIGEGIAWIYKLKKRQQPEIFIVDSPFVCLEEERKILRPLKSALENNRGVILYYRSCEGSIWDILIRESIKTPNSLMFSDGLRFNQDFHWACNFTFHNSFDNIRLLAGRLTKDINVIDIMTNPVTESYGAREWGFSSFISADNLLDMFWELAIYEFYKTARNISCNIFDRYVSFLRAGCFLSEFSEKHAIVSRRPTFTKMNNNMQLHCEDGPAIKWRDGTQMFYLNGVLMTEEVVTTAPDKLDPQIVLKARNVEVRKELVRKIGIDRVIKTFKGKAIDTWKGYELIRLSIPDMESVLLYLKMINPSTGAMHFEGVPPEITTCREALSWRVGGLDWDPQQLT